MLCLQQKKIKNNFNLPKFPYKIKCLQNVPKKALYDTWQEY